MNKPLLVSVVFVVGLVASFYAFNAYIYNEKQGDGNSYEPYRATLRGEYICLSRVDEGESQADVCAYGVKTDAGEQYAVDLALMSQSPVPLTLGQRFSANGIVTPIEQLSTDHWRHYQVSGIFSITDSVIVEGGTEEREEEEEGTYTCQADAKICPDGSSVGRSGPTCEFTACPPADATSSRVTTYLGGTATGLTVSVSPKEVVSDSRCPIEVDCVWAGTVEVRTVLTTPVSHGEHVLTLGKPQIFGDYTVTLVGVAPDKRMEDIPDSSYRFTFEIVR